MASIIVRSRPLLEPCLRAAQAGPLARFVPIYSTATAFPRRDLSWWSSAEHGRDGGPALAPLAVRHANTSSGGLYAPSALPARNRAENVPDGNLSVFVDSDHLPSLPVPNLNTTLDRLKETISPIAMNSGELVSTLQLIDEFAASAGPKLDLLLRHKASQTKNWLTHDWWTREAYYKSRKPLVINSNPAMIYPAFPFEVGNQCALVNCVAHLISGIIDFKLALQHGYNPEASCGAANEYRLDPQLCYNQYRDFFGGTRLPGKQVDTVELASALDKRHNEASDAWPGRHLSGSAGDGPAAGEQQAGAESQLASESRLGSAKGEAGSARPFSIVVSHRGKFFELELGDIENERGRIDKLISILDKIIVSAAQEGSADQGAAAGQQTHLDGAGVLTALGRSEWAEASELLDSESRAAILRAQFVVNLDTMPGGEQADPFSQPLVSAANASQPNDHRNEQLLAALGRQVLHGDSHNVGNRWFDKSFQLIVVADERAERLLGAGINYEHSFAEGGVVAKLIEYSYDKTVQKQRESINESNFFARQEVAAQSPAAYRRLRMFDETKLAQAKAHLKRARQDFASHINQFEQSYVNYNRYGANAIKAWRFSPDSWFQVGLLWAYYNVHKRLGPCYESASTRRFAYGRTETIRSLTKEVAQFCQEPSFETLKSAVVAHKMYANAANRADGIDRVLMGYKTIFNQIRSNEWPWGVPQSANGHAQRHPSSSQAMGADAQGAKQGFKLEDLFTEHELATIGAFFNSELVQRSFRYALSTSQVSSSHPDIYMTYGPYLADGYGCCYNITGQQIVAAITANSCNQSYSCEVSKLNERLVGSLDRMRDMVEEQRGISS